MKIRERDRMSEWKRRDHMKKSEWVKKEESMIEKE